MLGVRATGTRLATNGSPLEGAFGGVSTKMADMLRVQRLLKAGHLHLWGPLEGTVTRCL